MKGKHLLKLLDFTPAEINELLDLAEHGLKQIFAIQRSMLEKNL